MIVIIIILNKQFSQKVVEHTVPKRKLFIISPYLDKSSLCLRTSLQTSIINNISFSKTKINFKSSTGLVNFFRFKEKIPLCSCSNMFIIFGKCNATCYGKTYCHFKVRIGDHSRISGLTKKPST